MPAPILLLPKSQPLVVNVHVSVLFLLESHPLAVNVHVPLSCLQLHIWGCEGMHKYHMKYYICYHIILLSCHLTLYDVTFSGIYRPHVSGACGV